MLGDVERDDADLDAAVVRDHGDEVVLRLAGPLCIETIPTFARQLDEAVARGAPVTVVDIGDVSLLTAASLGVLAPLSVRLRAEGRSIVLRQPDRLARRVLEATGLTALVEPDEASATASVDDAHDQGAAGLLRQVELAEVRAAAERRRAAVRERRAAVNATFAEASAAAGRPRPVVVVSSDQDRRRTICHLVEDHGGEPVPAFSVEEGARLVHVVGAGTVLLADDLSLPDPDALGAPVVAVPAGQELDVVRALAQTAP